ncbi:MAG: hypothetical protein ABSA70_10770, partial [Terriglobia bacterium]
GKVKDLTPDFDQWVNAFAWAPDSDTIYFTAPERGRQPIFKVTVSKPGVVKIVDGFNDEIQATADGKSLVITRSSLTQPPEVYRQDLKYEGISKLTGHSLFQISHANDALMAELDLNPVEDVNTKGALGAQIHNLLVKPPGFDASKKYPGLMLVHGGPQSAWDDAWSYRWNAQMFRFPATGAAPATKT